LSAYYAQVISDLLDQILSLCEPYYREIAKEAVTKCDYKFSEGGYYGGQETCVLLDDALKALDAMGGE